jgi:hypothetical protein
MTMSKVETTVTTKMGQAGHMGKWEAACQMVRLVRDLACRLEEAGLAAKDDGAMIDDVIYSFLGECPKKVRDEVREG